MNPRASSRARDKGALIEVMENEDDAPWLTTFADMMMLLLVFFILMYAMHSLETEKFKAAVAKVEITNQEDGKQISLLDFVEQRLGGDPITFEESIGLNPQDSPAASAQNSLQAEMQSIIQSANLGDSVIAVNNGHQVIIRIDGGLLFDSGSANLRDGARIVFDTLAVTFADYPDYQIDIRGHTDDRPIATPRFASNWELSALRATSALRYFVTLGLPAEQFTATGYSDRLPLAENATREGRAANRRVEFVLEKRR